MITFVVRKNQRKKCVAGVPGEDYLSVHIVSSPKGEEKLRIDVGSMESAPGQPHTFSNWCEEPLKVGDEITIRIVEADKCDAPAEVRKDPPEKVTVAHKKKHVRELCKELGWRIVKKTKGD